VSARPDIDVSSRYRTPAAPARAGGELLGVKYREGFIKNRYNRRTFIMPARAAFEVGTQQAERHRSGVPRQECIAGRRFDRARTTSAQIIDMAREAGAKKVYFASLPAVRYPMSTASTCRMRPSWWRQAITDDEVRDIIGAIAEFYQDLEDLEHAVRHDNAKIEDFDTRVSRASSDGRCDAGVSRAPAGERSDEASSSVRWPRRGLKSVR